MRGADALAIVADLCYLVDRRGGNGPRPRVPRLSLASVRTVGTPVGSSASQRCGFAGGLVSSRGHEPLDLQGFLVLQGHEAPQFPGRSRAFCTAWVPRWHRTPTEN